MDKEGLVEGACAEIAEHTNDRSATLIFSSGIRPPNHGQHIVDVLKAKHGIECGFVTGDTPDGVRAAILARFRSGGEGGLKYLCNVNVLTTGFDAPHIDCVALVRPTMSPGLYYQMVGRGFRLHPGKNDCLVLDFGGNVLRHGPVDAIRIATDDRGDGEAPAKECPNCQALIAAGYQTCPQCGHQFPDPNRQQHEAKASTEGILSGQTTREEHRVSETTYHVHYKRSDPSAPLTMRVEYRVPPTASTASSTSGSASTIPDTPARRRKTGGGNRPARKTYKRKRRRKRRARASGAAAVFRTVRSVLRATGNTLQAARSVFQVGWSLLQLIRNVLRLKWSVLRADGKTVRVLRTAFQGLRSVLQGVRNQAGRRFAWAARRAAGAGPFPAEESSPPEGFGSSHGVPNMARGTSNYIPRPDGNFSAWAQHYYDAVEKWWSANGFDESELKPLKEALSAWVAAYAAHVKAQAAAEGARQAKDAARAALEKEVRPVTNFVQGYPKTTDADRAEIGITVRDTSRTPAPKPTTRPLVTVGVNARLTHELRLVDSGEGSGSPTRRGRGGKPEGVAGAEVWVKLIDAGQPAPTDPNALSFLTMTTRPTLRTDFRAADGGKTAVYMLRWVNTRGEKGPWSEVTTATVAA